MRFDGKTTKQKATYVNLEELSGVTIGAHTGADVTIIKADKDELAKNLFLQAVQNLEVQSEIRDVIYKIWDYTDAFEDAAYDIVWNIEKYPDPVASFTEVLQSFGGIVSSLKKNKDDTEAKSELAKVVKKGSLKIMKLIRDSNEAVPATTPKKETEMSKTDTKVTDDAAVEAMQKQIVLLTALSAMSDLSKSHYATLDDAGKEAFAKSSVSAQELAVTAAADADAIVYTAKSGDVFRKSDDERMIAMAKREDAAIEKTAKLEAEAQDSRLAKQASIELSHVPGEEVDKIAMLKAIDTIGDVEQKSRIMSILAAQNGSMVKAFEVQGTQVAKTKADANADLDTMAKAYQTEHSVPYTQAYDAVLCTSEGAALYAAI